jgi:hypothetical protein
MWEYVLHTEGHKLIAYIKYGVHRSRLLWQRAKVPNEWCTPGPTNPFFTELPPKYIHTGDTQPTLVFILRKTRRYRALYFASSLKHTKTRPVPLCLHFVLSSCRRSAALRTGLTWMQRTAKRHAQHVQGTCPGYR